MPKCEELFRPSVALAALLALGACSSGLRQNPVPDAESPALSAQATTLPAKTITESAGDAEQLGSGAVLTASPVLELGTRSDGPQTVGLRFSGITVPRGSDIVTAYLDFVASGDQAGTASLRFQGLAATNPAAFTAAANDIGSRARTAASATWTPPAWTAGATYSTINLAGVVEEITNRADWTGNAALALVVTGSGIRQAHAWDAPNTLQPVLRITYNPPPAFASCLSNPHDLKLTPSGTLYNYVINSQVSNSAPDGTRVAVDARNATFRTNQTKPNGGLKPTFRTWVDSTPVLGQLCISGGLYDTGLSDSANWDASFQPNAVIALAELENAANSVIEGITVHVGGDSVLFGTGTNNWTVRDSYIRHAGDDFIENDVMYKGLVDDVLVDWAFTGFSCRSGPGGDLFQNNPVTIQDSLIALRRQQNSATGNNHYRLFKLQTASEPQSNMGCKLVLKNNVFLVETSQAKYINPEDDPNSNPAYDSFDKTACTNNTIIYLRGDGDGAAIPARINGVTRTFSSYTAYLQDLQARHPGCFTVKIGAEHASLWSAERDEWFGRHESHPSYPRFAAYR